MSIAYSNRKKAKRRQLQQDIVELEFGNIPEHLKAKYPDKDRDYILAACRANLDYSKLIKRMIRQKKVSRYVVAKDGKGKPLYNGTYKFSMSDQKLVVKRYFIQKFVGTELVRAAQEKAHGK